MEFGSYMSKIVSPLMDSHDITLVETLDVKKLISDWQDIHTIDVSNEFGGNDTIFLYECNKSKLQFFWPQDIAGSDYLYAKLQKYDWYYMKDKWEYGMALKYLKNASSILEVGSGVGYFISIVQKKGIAIKGLELNKSSVEIAKKNNLPIENIQLNDYSLIYPDSVDAVCSFQVLEHLSEPKKFIESSLRILKRGGVLILSVPNANSYIKYQYNLLNMPPHHMTRWKAETFKYIEQIFPLKLISLKNEPLQPYHVDQFVDVYFHQASKKLKLLQPFINSYTFNISVFFIRRILRRILTGHTLMAVFIKI